VVCELFNHLKQGAQLLGAWGECLLYVMYKKNDYYMQDIPGGVSAQGECGSKRTTKYYKNVPSGN